MSRSHALPLLLLPLLGGCVDLGGLGKDDGGGSDGSGSGDPEEVDCDALEGKQVDLPEECRSFATLSPTVRTMRRIRTAEGIGINDPSRTGGDGPIPWHILPEGTDFGPGLAAASPVAEAAAVWGQGRLQPGEDDDSPDLLLASPNEDGFGTALVGMVEDGGQTRMLVSSTDGEYVERYAVTPESFPDGFAGVAPPAATEEHESIEAVEVAWTGLAGFELGVSIAEGDFDGDGHSDVAMTAPGDGEGGALYLSFGPHEGVMDVFSTALRVAGDPDHPVEGGLTSLGDLDGDGADELVLDMPEAAGGGIVLLAGLGPHTATSELLADLGRFLPGSGGAAVATLWDIDDDGIPEVALGAPDDSSMEPGGGAVHVLSGAAVLSGGASTVEDAVLVTIYGESEGAALGTSLVAAGDTNGDGAPELLIGAPFATNVDGEETGALVYVDDFSASSYAGQRGYGFYGETAGSQLGAAVDAGVDFDEDGFPDIVAGEGASGEVLVVFGVGAGR